MKIVNKYNTLSLNVVDQWYALNIFIFKFIVDTLTVDLDDLPVVLKHILLNKVFKLFLLWKDIAEWKKLS